MDQLSENLRHGPSVQGDRELKYDWNSKNMVKFLGKTMKSWRVELNCGAETPYL